MGKALRQRLGVRTNPVAAYAWLSLFSNTPPGSIVGRVQINELALQLDTSSLQQAQSLATQFKAGNWQAPLIRAIPEGDTRLKLGASSSAGSPLHVVSPGKSIAGNEEGGMDDGIPGGCGENCPLFGHTAGTRASGASAAMPHRGARGVGDTKGAPKPAAAGASFAYKPSHSNACIGTGISRIAL
jgi:hypothetical protein